jgi:anti-sigma factor RsiW
VDHLTDENLNELLDHALDAHAQAVAGAHLAGCQACSARLDSMRALFARLEALPDIAIERDLSVSVVEALRQAAPAPLPAARRAPRMAGLIFAGQAALAAILLAFAWPVAASFASQVNLPFATLGLTRIVSELGELLAEAPMIIAQPPRSWTMLFDWLASAPAALNGLLPAWLSPLQVALIVAAAGGLWLLGNAVILTPPLRARLRRNS